MNGLEKRREIKIARERASEVERENEREREKQKDSKHKLNTDCEMVNCVSMRAMSDAYLSNGRVRKLLAHCIQIVWAIAD